MRFIYTVSDEFAMYFAVYKYVCNISYPQQA
jgi:hypothetical protein